VVVFAFLRFLLFVASGRLEIMGVGVDGRRMGTAVRLAGREGTFCREGLRCRELEVSAQHVR